MTSTSAFVPDIFHYCDRWCERCAFQERCERRQDQRAMEDVVRADNSELVVWLMDGGTLRHDHPSWMSASERRVFDGLLGRHDPPVTEEEFNRLQTAVDEKAGRVFSHALTGAGVAYERVVREEIEQLRDQIYPTGERQADLALEALARYAVRIGSLAARAAGGLVGGLFGDEREADLRGVQSDANGCAKLLRLLIAESRVGWNLLAGHECVAELEGHMLWHIYGIDDLVKENFPRAMEFVRPGFDES